MVSTAIKSGPIYKKGGLIKTLKQRWLILTDQCLEYYESVSKFCKLFFTGQRCRFTFFLCRTAEPAIDRIYLRMIDSVTSTNDYININSNKYYEFILKGGGNVSGRTYQMYCESTRERDDWIKAISHAISEERKRINTLKEAAASVQPHENDSAPLSPRSKITPSPSGSSKALPPLPPKKF